MIAPERAARLDHPPGFAELPAYFFELTIALKSAPARNLGTECFGTLIDAPVAGLRAVRAGLTCFSKTPNPVIDTLSPRATVAWIVSRTALTASAAVFLSPKWEVARTGKPSPRPLLALKVWAQPSSYKHLRNDGIGVGA